MPKPFKKKSEPPYEAEALMDVMRLFSDDFSAATKVGRTSAKTLNRSRQLTGMLQMMTDNIPDMIWAKDVGNRYLFANLSMRERLLCAESLDEVIGRTDMYFAERQRALRPGDTDWHTFGELCRDSDTIVLKSRVPHLFEESGNVRGIPLRLDVHKAPFFDAGGNLIGTVGCGRDVTEIAGLRSALRESESRFRLVLDSFPDAVVLHRDNIILYANGIAAQLAGLSDPATMIGKPIWDFVPCDLHLMFNVRIAQAKRSDRPLPMVSYRVERTGAPPLFVESVVLRIDFGGEKALLTIMRDATDRRIAENSLRESEQRSRLILDMSPHSMMLHRDGIILYANPAAAGMLGYEVPGELEGRELMEFVHPPFRNHVRDRIKRLRFVGMTLPPDIQQCITKAGDTVDIEAIATLISYQGKKTVLSIARDMTSQRALESAYKMLLNAMTEGFVLLEVLFDEDDNPYDCRYLSVNAAWERIRGKHATDVIGKTILEVHPDFPRDWIAYYGKVAQSGAPLRAKRVSGDGLKWFVITAYRTGPRQVAATIVDITDKELAHAALRASEERFRLFFEEAPVGYQALDKNGMLLDINNTWRETLGYDRDEVVGRSLREFLSPASQTIHDTAFADFLTTGEMHGLELDMQHRNGSTVPVSVEGRVAYDEHGRFKQTHCIFYNISDRKRLEEQLRQSQKMEAIGVLAGGIAHDFNNIIQAVVGNLHLLRTRVPQSSDALSFVDEILDLTQRAADLTGGLLAFSRKQILLTRVFDLNSIVKSTLSMLERLIGETIEIESYLFPKPLVVSADIGQIQQVIMNLATNARDAMPEGGGLRITTCRLEMPRPEGGSQSPLRYAELSVSDTGAGIPEEHIEHIFEPFYTTKEVGKGTGLGLAVAYGIISQHGGSIEAISMNGSGTTMRVLLPLSDDTPLERHDIAPDSVHDEGGTILLVEDDDTVRLAIQRLLEHSGYTVLVARDGIEGTDIFRHHASAVDVALLDVVMPRMSGKQLCDQLKALKPELKVIFMSGYPDDRLGGILCDGVSYMSKPVMPDKLLAGIRSVLGS